MIKSDVFNIKNYEGTKVIELKPKLGRNDLCHCGNECLVDHEQNAYCDFCSFASENLPCPKKGNISYEIFKE